MEVEIDRYPVAELLARYGVGKSKLYADYLGQCKIIPTKIQGRAYVTGDELKILDEYHAAEGNGREAIALFLSKLESGDMATVETLPVLLSDEAKECLKAIALHYTAIRLSQKMMLTIPEAVMVSGLSKSGIRKAIIFRDLAAVKLGGRWMVQPRDLQEYIEKLFDRKLFMS